MKSQKALGKILCTKQPCSIIQFLTLSSLWSCLYFFSDFTDALWLFSIAILIVSEAFPCNFLIEEISLMSSVQRTSTVNDPLTFLIEKGILYTSPFSFTTRMKTLLSSFTQCVVGSCRRPKSSHISMGKWKKLKRGKFENNVNVVFNSNEEKHLLTKLDEMG